MDGRDGALSIQLIIICMLLLTMPCHHYVANVYSDQSLKNGDQLQMTRSHNVMFNKFAISKIVHTLLLLNTLRILFTRDA